MPEYFIYKRQGPYGIKTLSQLVQSGEVDNNAFVWTPGMKSLEYAKKMPELSPWFEEQELKTEKVKVNETPYAEAKTIPAPQSATLPQQYKVAVNSQSTGPFSLEQLVEKIKAKEILPQTLVWKPGLTQWIPARDVADFSEAFAALPKEISVSDTAALSLDLQSRAQAAGTAERQQVSEEPEPQGWGGPPQSAVDEGQEDFHPAGDYAPSDIAFDDDGTPKESAELDKEESPGVPQSPVSLLNEDDAGDILPWTRFILPGGLVLLGSVVTFLAMKTALLAAPLAKLTSLLSKFPIIGGRVKALAAGAAQGVPLLVKIIPGGLFILSGVLALVITLLSRQSSEQSEPEQP